MTQRITVMLLFGGESLEHTVSISSAGNVYAALDNNKFDIILTFIDKFGRWWLIDSIDQVSDVGDCIEIVPVLGSKSFISINGDNVIEPDVILPILHGENGEDGTIQGLAKLIHIPIVGCKVAASAVCMDKVLTKQILEYNDIKTVPYAVHKTGDDYPDYQDLSLRLGSVLFIKPAGCGSSVGVSKVKSADDFIKAIHQAHQYDDKVLIEKAINARELEVAMIGSGATTKASVVGEIKPDSEFYDFESKYDSSSKSRAIIPADIDPNLSDIIRQIAIKAYNAIGCQGLSRIDFFLSDDGDLYLNEINTLPGFTNISMYPKLWRHSGMTYGGLIEELICIALEK